MLTITVRLDEKISTASQYENRTAGVLIEESHLELHSPEAILNRTAELFAMAKQSVEEQLKGPAPTAPSEGNGRGESGQNGHPPGNGHALAPAGNGQANGNGHATTNGNGRRSYGRPTEEPTPKQRSFLRKIARDRNLGPETIRDICKRVLGKEPKNLDKQDMSRLIKGLLGDGEAA